MGPRMANETPHAPPNAPRTHFHLILAGVFFPLVSVIAGWVLAILHVVRGSETDAQLKWTRLLVALVVVDALVAASGVWIVANTDDLTRLQPGQVESTGPRIGVDLETAEPRIRRVLPASPADKAGLQVGDRIEKIDGVPVSTAKEATDAVRKTEAGGRRVLTLSRNGSTVEATVVPEQPPKAESFRLFDPWPESEGKESWRSYLVFVPAALLVGLGILWSLRRSSGAQRVWWGALGALVVSFGIPLLATSLFGKIQGHLSTGTILISMMLGQVACIALTFAARAWAGRDSAEPAAPLTPLRAGLQGVFYLITGSVRIMTLALAVDLFAFDGHAMGPQMMDRMASSALGAPGIALFVLSVVLLAPISEEFLFRGFLLPRLTAKWGETGALVTSSGLFMLLHPHYGIYMPLIFLYGWVFGWTRLRSGSLKVPILLHMAVNGLATAVTFARH